MLRLGFCCAWTCSGCFSTNQRLKSFSKFRDHGKLLDPTAQTHARRLSQQVLTCSVKLIQLPLRLRMIVLHRPAVVPDLLLLLGIDKKGAGGSLSLRLRIRLGFGRALSFDTERNRLLLGQ